MPAPLHVFLSNTTPQSLVESPFSGSFTFYTIQRWAEQVAPGSPSPSSPSSTKLSLTSSPRRPLEIIVPPPPSSPFHDIQKSPSTALTAEHHIDLTAWGYTSTFVRLPKTPETPEEYLELAKQRKTSPPPTTPKSASAGIKSFILKPFRRGRSKSHSGQDPITVDNRPQIAPPVPPMPDFMKSTPDASSSSSSKKSGLSSLLPSRSKSSSAPKPTKPILDPQQREALRAQALQQQVEMAAFIAGGRPFHHAQDIAREIAKGTGQPVSVPIKRDGKYYFGEDERDEYKALLSPSTSDVSSSSRRDDRAHHRKSRRASAHSTSLGPLIQEAENPTGMPFLLPTPGSAQPPISSSSGHGHSKGRRSPLPRSSSTHRFEDSFIPASTTTPMTTRA